MDRTSGKHGNQEDILAHNRIPIDIDDDAIYRRPPNNGVWSAVTRCRMLYINVNIGGYQTD